jgi:hypothetical protein
MASGERPSLWIPRGEGDSRLANVGQDSLAFLRAELGAGFSVSGGNAEDDYHEDIESHQHAERRSEIHPHPAVEGDKRGGHLAAPWGSPQERDMT